MTRLCFEQQPQVRILHAQQMYRPINFLQKIAFFPLKAWHIAGNGTMLRAASQCLA